MTQKLYLISILLLTTMLFACDYKPETITNQGNVHIILIDAKTGCEYIKFWNVRGFSIRFDSDGKAMCGKKSDKIANGGS